MAAKKRDSEDKENGARRTVGVMIYGAVALAFGGFAAISVFGYHPDDPNLFLPQHTPGQATGNPCGLVGANLAFHLISTYGLTAWILWVLPLAWGVHVLARRRMESPWRKLAGAVLLLWSLSAVLGVASWGGGWFDRLGELANVPIGERGAGRAGGLLGYWSAGWMRPVFGPLGSYVVAAGVVFLSLVLLAEGFADWSLSALGRLAVVAVRRASGRRLFRGAAGTGLEEEGRDEAGARPALVGGKAPNVHATFGQPEAELRKARAAARAEEDKAPPAPAPIIKIARVTEPMAAAATANGPSVAETEAERDDREKREIAALSARAAGPAAPEKPSERPAEKPARREAAAAAPAPETAKESAPPPPPVIRQSSDPANAGVRTGVPERPGAEKSRGAKPAPAKSRLAELDFKLPESGLLDKVEHHAQISNEMLAKRGNVLTDALKEFKIGTRLVAIDRGPAVTIYELELAAGIRVQKVMELADNLAMAMRAPNVRIIAPLPGRDSIGIEVPNTEREVVRLRSLLESKEFQAQSKDWAIPFVIGRDAAGAVLADDLARMPHLLVAGATGSGKSVCLNSFIVTLLMTRSPADVRLLLVDPKMVELSIFKGVPHLVAPVVTDMRRAAGIFEWAIRKMDERYEMLSMVGVRDISRFNRMPPADRASRASAAGDESPERFREKMPYIVVVVDELADLMMLAGREIEVAVTRLAQKSRGVGIHIILATQRPSVDVVTGLIKTNMPARIAFQVSSKVDSRTIIDQNGADKLMGMGDMLYLPPTASAPVRAKGTYVSDEEVGRVVDFVKKQAEPEFAPDLASTVAGDGEDLGGNTANFRDDLYDESVRVVLETQRGSVSLLQRRLGVGYTRAAKLIDMMAERGILGPYRGSKPRDILVTLEQWEAGEAGPGSGSGKVAGSASGGMAGRRPDERGPRQLPDDGDSAEDELDRNPPEEDADEAEPVSSESRRA